VQYAYHYHWHEVFLPGHITSLKGITWRNDVKVQKLVLILYLLQQVPACGQVPQQTLSRGPAARGPAVKGTPGNHTANGLTECGICGRNFASDRIAKHQEICVKTTKKKRKVFDPVKQRVKGTEAEGFLKKGQPQAVTVSIVMYHKHTEGWGNGTSALQAAIKFNNFPTRCDLFSLLHFCRQLYMFRVLTPIIRSWYSCKYSFWYRLTGSTTICSCCWVEFQINNESRW